jgi:Zn-dependent protease with chaperone function
VDDGRFKRMVARLEEESSVAPGAYRLKVAALMLLGFGILAMVVGVAGLGLFVLVGFALAVVLSGGAALILLLKLGKLLIVLAIPLWYLVKASIRALFVRLPPPQGREISRVQAPALFAAIDEMRRQMKGPRFHHVLIVDEVNAAVVQRPAFGLVGWPRNYLLLGLPLLESMPPAEALAVVAHEYGHLAGAHGRFSGFIYRLRHTWGTVQAYTDHIQGWLGRLVAPVVRWYAPYFNAYTFVLARANEYAADAASAELVGTGNAANALKRVNLVGPRHQRFLDQTYERIATEPEPPRDLLCRWAEHATQPPAESDAQRWLGDALDREGHFANSHPTLRARLAALPDLDEPLDRPPPVIEGESAARVWLGDLLDKVRAEFQAQWAERMAGPWAERHAQVQQDQRRLVELRALDGRDTAQELELLQLVMRLEPEVDLREPFAAFNAANVDHALALFLEGVVCLGKGERRGLDLLERAMSLDAEATKPACERAHAFLVEQKDTMAAEVYAERWRRRDELETQRAQQLQTLDPAHALVSHRLEAAVVGAVKGRLEGKALKYIGEVYLARRVIPADESVVQHVMGVRLSWWGRRRGKQIEVVNRLAAMEWPLPLVFVTLDGKYAPMRKKYRALPGAQLI